jgi:hypothetical protein
MKRKLELVLWIVVATLALFLIADIFFKVDFLKSSRKLLVFISMSLFIVVVILKQRRIL